MASETTVPHIQITQFFQCDICHVSLAAASLRRHMCLFRFAVELNVLEHSLQRNCFGTFTFSCLTNVPKPALDVTFLTLSCTVFTWRSRSSLFQNLWSQSLQVSRGASFFYGLSHGYQTYLFSEKFFPQSEQSLDFFTFSGFSLCTRLVCLLKLAWSFVS